MADKPSKYDDITTGKLADRRFGLRIDDEIEVYIIGGDRLRVVRGRVLDYRKDLQLIDEKGLYHRINYDWITDLVVLKHNRPLPEEDEEYAQPPPAEPEESREPPEDHAYM